MSSLIDGGARGRRRLYQDRRAETRAGFLSTRYALLEADALLHVMATEIFPGRIAVVSSFGTESAVLLHLVARVDRNLPVLFLDTGRHFDETQAYLETLRCRLGLTNLRRLAPDGDDIADADPGGELAATNPDFCCHLRKTQPLAQALGPYDAWITGRKRFQGGERGKLALVEALDGRIKLNPLATWSQKQIATYFLEQGLPHHPLAARGFTSVGCAPCTAPPESAEDPRSGRWAARQKTECGIHKAAWATPGATAWA